MTSRARPDGGRPLHMIADRLLQATAPIVEARPPIEELTPAQQARFQDALEPLGDQPAAVSLAGRNASSRTHSA